MGERVCPSCGLDLDAAVRETLIKVDLHGDGDAASNTESVKPGLQMHTALGHSIDGAMFVPGTLILDRYRIVGLLGRGGMGEVYRADDLKLGQAVALKFLPEALANDDASLTRFHREVRIARQVSHPNVCRVFDIGETNGFQFLSMEYIDGEDLDSLLRRIGRLPEDKAIELSRQLCAGLAAAHDAGVLHRDLKPANVMIDGRGRARITDFGLAVVFEHLRVDDGLAGTPAYMAPEQFSGGAATAKSDIYALGLVLYELFTGKQAFQAHNLAGYIKLHRESVPPTPTSLVRDLDPLVESAILRCIDKDPANRPASALTVASALPGGDPLFAALAAGETPSPEMVAAAGEKLGLRVWVAASLFSAILVALVVTVVIGSTANVLDVAPFETPPEILRHRAREVTSQLGYPDRPTDTGDGMHYDMSYLRYLDGNGTPEENWARIATMRPVPVHYWYRESPDYLQVTAMEHGSGELTEEDPPANTAGMNGLELDAQGNLRSFYSVAPTTEVQVQQVDSATDWKKVLALAGLDDALLQRAEPEWIPRNAYDSRVAWTGTYPGQDEPKLRVEAASRRGKVVSFDVIEPWVRPERSPLTTGQKANGIFVISLFGLVVIGATLLARSNLKNGKGDNRGALRFAVFVGLSYVLSWAFAAHHVPTAGEATMFSQAVANSLFYGGLVWLLYIALEPLVRRRWPTAIITWSRVLDGRLRDPLVGRDLMVGVFAGVCMTLLDGVQRLLTGDTAPSGLYNLDSLISGRRFLGWFFGSMAIFMLFPLLVFFVLFLIRALLRNEWLVAVIFVILAIIPGILFGMSAGFVVVNIFFFLGIFLLAVRWGLFAVVVAFWISQILVQPFSLDLSAWYAGTSSAVVLVVFGLAVYGFRTALGGQRLFGEGLLQD
jgi:serine/threonine-protein kinase